MMVSFLTFSSLAKAYTVTAANDSLRQTTVTLIEEALNILPKSIRGVLPVDLNFILKSGLKHTGEFSNKTVEINQELIQDFIQNPKKEKFVSFTRHPDFKTYLVATIVHELSHAYDHSGQNVLEYKIGNKLSQNCYFDPTSEDKTIQLDPDCYTLQKIKGRISGDPEFLNLIFQYFNGSERTTRNRGNFFEGRSVDPWEFKKGEESSEAFATHMEFFTLDPDFKCRKPSIYNYFSERFNHIPFVDVSCENFAKQFYISPSTSNFRPQMLKPTGKLYQIHYFLAGPGEGVTSGFGHSMLRLVYCNPERKEASDDCLFDVSHHVVISPAAGIADFDYSAYDGLMGKFPTFLFASQLGSKVVDYTKIEEREIFSIPLKLTESQMKNLENSIFESHWTYKNKYYFLSNNCAVEVLNLLKRSLPENYAIQKTMEIKPIKVLENLYSAGLVESKDLTFWRQDVQKRFYFPPYNQTFVKLEKYLAQYLNNTSATNYRKLLLPQRTLIVEQVKALENQEAKKRFAAAISFLEENIQAKLRLTISKKIAAELAANNKTKPVEFENYKKEYSVWMAPPQILDIKQYGVPSLQETDIIIENNKSAFATLDASQKRLNDFGKSASLKYPEAQELEKSLEISRVFSEL